MERDLNVKEQELFDQLISRFSRSTEQLRVMLEEAEYDDEALVNASDSLVNLFNLFKTGAEHDNGSVLADALVAGLSAGTVNDIVLEILSVRVGLMERAAFAA